MIDIKTYIIELHYKLLLLKEVHAQSCKYEYVFLKPKFSTKFLKTDRFTNLYNYWDSFDMKWEIKTDIYHFGGELHLTSKQKYYLPLNFGKSFFDTLSSENRSFLKSHFPKKQLLVFDSCKNERYMVLVKGNFKNQLFYSKKKTFYELDIDLMHNYYFYASKFMGTYDWQLRYLNDNKYDYTMLLNNLK